MFGEQKAERKERKKLKAFLKQCEEIVSVNGPAIGTSGQRLLVENFGQDQPTINTYPEDPVVAQALVDIEMFDPVGPMPIFRGDLFGPNQTLNVLLVDCSTEVQNSPLLGLGG